MTLSQLVKFANSKDSSDPTKVRLTNQAVPTGMALLLRNLGDETNSHKTILELQSLSRTGVKTLIVPGLEGMAGQAWYTLAQSLECPTYILQNGKTWESTDIDSIFEGIFPDVVELFKDEDKFNIIGYSFGSVLTLKIARALEVMGKTGKMILIDGSPKFIKALAKVHMIDSSDETIQTFVLISLMMIIFPDDNGDKIKRVLSEITWETRLATIAVISKENTIYSEEYLFMIVRAVVNRLKLTMSLNLEKLPKLDFIPVTLIRPSEFSLVDIEEDYGLSAYLEQKAEIKFVEGNHLTMLDNPALFEMINKHIDK
jgi:fatty acid synthase, animal type